MGVTVRPAVPADYPAIGRIRVDAYRAHGHFDGEGSGGYAATLADVAGRADLCDLLVAVDDDTVLGTVAYCAFGTPMAEVCREGEAEFRMLAVDPAAERRGVGRALVTACLDRARAQGCTAVAMSSRPDVAPAAVRLYERLGFVRTPDRDWSPVPDISLIGWRIPL